MGHFWGQRLSCAVFSVLLLTTTAGFAARPANHFSLENEIQKRALRYFLDNSNPATGQVLDKACAFSTCSVDTTIASIAATGFGITVIANSATRGWVTPQFAREYVLKALNFAYRQVPRRRGWFVHFYDWKTGQRVWHSEYSTIDSAFFLAGALYACRTLDNKAICDLSDRIYRETDFWDMMTDGGHLPNKRTLSMAYFDKTGYTPSQWNMYAEQMLLLVLGLGHPTHPLPAEIWRSFDRDITMMPTKSGTPKLYMGLANPLFVHQYSQLFLDLRHFHDGFTNYYHNSKIVSLFQRGQSKTGFWGFSAGWSSSGYQVFSTFQHGATVCIGCAITSALFLPNLVLADAHEWLHSQYSKQIWSKYGFTDSLDLDKNWFSPIVLGITVGPEYLALADLNNEHSIWRDFMSIPEIKNGLAKAQATINQNRARR